MPEGLFEVPVLWIHGHTHTRFDYRVKGCRVVCNPRGYELWGGNFEVDDFDAGFVIEVKLGIPGDRDRSFRRIVTDDSGLS